MKKLSRLLPLFFFILPILLSAQTGYDIARAVDDRKVPLDITAELEMVLTNKKGKTRTNVIRNVSKDNSEKMIIWFYSPADDKGVAFLKIEHKNGDDEMRLWLPAFKKVRRISSSKTSDSFMGSDMSYEDMTNRELDEYTYKILEEVRFDNQDCYKIEVLPKKDTDTDYSKHIEWVLKEKFLVLKSESYDKAGKLLKIRNVINSNIKEYHIPTEIHVENVQKKHQTRLTFKNLELDTGVDDKLFQEKNLKRLPI